MRVEVKPNWDVLFFRESDVQTFACLLVYEGGDSWEELNALKKENLTPFTGSSSSHPHIFSILQHLINTRSAFLNGDWCFINSIIGLMSPSAQHPCPICDVCKNNLLISSHLLQPRSSSHNPSKHRTHLPLLSIDSRRIVPTPLHLFLGISNRIILDCFSELLGKELVESTLKSVKTIHTAGCGGKSDLYDLNGPEISKWLKRGCNEKLKGNKEMTDQQRATHSQLSRWLTQLHTHLLHKKEWGRDDIEAWRCVVVDIHSNWQSETKQKPFPKLHMLEHSLEFAEQHRFLGRASEAQIESFHSSYITLFNNHHFNQSHNTPERLRRCLADATLRVVQPAIV
jgi:hypothetical protein